jgi:hypothetical protein
VLNVKADAAPKILLPLLPTTQLLEAKKLKPSIIVTSSPTLGLAGNVTVTGFVLVSTIN